jgi:tetrapyrrole methylase family protein/MazG family protein
VITLIGLGAGDAETLSRGAERALREASARQANGTGALFLRTARHPVVDTLQVWGLNFETFDALYAAAPDFQTVYAEIAARVLAGAQRLGADGAPFPVAFAVPGHPLFGEDSVRRIRAGAEAAGIETRLVSSGSFVEAALTAAGVSLADGCDVRDALTLLPSDQVDRDGSRTSGRADVSRGLLLYQVFDTASASHAKLCLMRDYPDDWEVALIRWAGVAGREEVRRIPLFRLDREPADHLTTVYVPPLPPSLRRPDFASLVGVMARLRAPDGCPWDREQTHTTLKRYFIEETYEVLEAIEANDPDLLCEELGDALLQVVFHAQLASEEGVFIMDDVTARIVEKLVRRHPHVFGTVEVSGSDEVLRNWEQIKRAEKTDRDASWRESVLDGVPKGLPALMQAMEISRRAVKVGFEWDRFVDVLAKLDEEIAELKAELAHEDPDRDAVFAEIGDLLFTVVQIARWQRADPEDALRTMLARFSARFRYIEQRAREQGRPLTDMTLAEMDALWNEAKARGL